MKQPLQLHDGEWIAPTMKGFRMECCRCRLEHTMDFIVVKQGGGHSVVFRSTRTKTKRSKRK